MVPEYLPVPGQNTDVGDWAEFTSSFEKFNKILAFRTWSFPKFVNNHLDQPELKQEN